MSANKPGRPSLLTPELMQEVCDRISEGRGLKEVAADKDMVSYRSLCRYIAEDDKFAAMVQRARENAACVHVEESIAIVDEPIAEKDNARATWLKNRAEIRQRAAALLHPGRFSPRGATATSEPPAPPQEVDNFELARGLAFLLFKGDLPASVLTPAKPPTNDALELARGLAFLAEKGENLLPPPDDAKVH